MSSPLLLGNRAPYRQGNPSPAKVKHQTRAGLQSRVGSAASFASSSITQFPCTIESTWKPFDQSDLSVSSVGGFPTLSVVNVSEWAQRRKHPQVKLVSEADSKEDVPASPLLSCQSQILQRKSNKRLERGGGGDSPILVYRFF